MKKESLLRVDRVIGNNVILAQSDTQGMEYVLMGKGIGFGIKSGELLAEDDKRIEKRFRLDDPKQMKHYHAMMEEADPEVIRITEAILADIEERFGGPLNNKVYYSLPSHIQFVLYRLQNGMEIVNPFLQETKLWFPAEYEAAGRAAAKIQETFGVDLPEDEIGFLTYHVHSALTNVAAWELAKFSNVVTELVERIEALQGIAISRDSMDYRRLVTDLRYTVERISQGKHMANPLLPELRKKFKGDFALAQDLSALIAERLGTEVPDEEVGYIAIELYRFFQGLDQHHPV
ncbi:BglG family transcriptional antiterminator [Paenibacillus taihuensis]|uniref:BglG family transcriptional antiterminator n=1 Tax=Paenibacillus taihuensis TaxID=1156355 RepID=A0A3D9SCS2_9BACL|nr:PRD domain-containing protein [Paenibacillus taihuensis]REE91392.1 BglG family transcriptional antiterminator [Paenibacillus taihuensis]